MNNYLLDKFNKIEYSHWWWEGRRFLIKWLLGKKKYRKILDVGCGTGETLSYLETIYPRVEVYGVDSSIKAIVFSKSRGHKNVIKANALHLPFKNDFFDAVLLLDVLEHIKDDQTVVNEVKRVLKKSGRMIITSPGLNFIWSNHDINQGHYRRYTQREIRKLAFNAELNTSFVGYFNFFLGFPIMIIRLLSKIRMFKAFADYNNSVNYDIANIGLLNSILKFIFIKEIQMLKFIRYPFGISISAVFIKK